MGSASSISLDNSRDVDSKNLTSVLPGGNSGYEEKSRGETGSRQRKRREDYVKDHKDVISDLVHNGLKQIITMRPTSFFSSPRNSSSDNNKSVKNTVTVNPTETFMDSKYYKQWLSEEDATALFNYFAVIGEAQRPNKQPQSTPQSSTVQPIGTVQSDGTAIETARKVHSKYPLWTKYYGLRRHVDNAIALDRWGSYHESWLRVEDPPAILTDVCDRLRKQFQPNQPESVNSMVVNYYYDGENTYIPAHRDTVACLQDNSEVICLSLGTSRDFVFVPNDQCGHYVKSNMSIVKEWRVNHGDLFAIGMKTNEAYCHAVPQERDCCNLRISIIFRSIDKSFLDNIPRDTLPIKTVQYATPVGKTKDFQAECIVCDGYDDLGEREHIGDMIQEREDKKKLNQLLKQQEKEKEKEKEKGKENGQGDNEMVAVIIDKEQAKALYKKGDKQGKGEGKEEVDEIVEKVVTVIPLTSVPLLSDYEKEYFAQNLLDTTPTLSVSVANPMTDTAAEGPEVSPTEEDEQTLLIPEVSISGKMLLQEGNSSKKILRYSFLSPNEQTFLTGSPSSKANSVIGGDSDSRKNSGFNNVTSNNTNTTTNTVIQKTLDSYYMGNGVAVPKFNKGGNAVGQKKKQE